MRREEQSKGMKRKGKLREKEIREEEKKRTEDECWDVWKKKKGKGGQKGENERKDIKRHINEYKKSRTRE